MACFSDDWFYVRVPKSGSSGLRTWLRDRHGWKEVSGPQHAPLTYYRDQGVVGGRKTFATLRAPCEWYGSAYFHLRRLEGHDPWPEGFRAWLYQATHAARHIPLHPVPYINGQWRHVGEGQQGLWTAAWGLIAGGADALIATDRIEEGIQALLGLKGPTSVQNRRVDLDAGPCPAYADLYDEEMMQWVRRADGARMAAWGVQAFSPSAWAVREPEASEVEGARPAAARPRLSFYP